MGTDVRIQQGYRFALAPTRAQEEFLGSCVGASRFWFNQALAEVKTRLDRRAGGEDVRVPWSYHALCSELGRDWRAERCDWQSEVVCGSYQAGFEALGRALQNFSEGRRAGRRVGFPRFRRRGGPHTESVIFQRPRIVDARYVELDGRCGPVRAKERMSKLTRLLGEDEHARILRSTVSRQGGAWFVSFTVERSPKRRRARRPDAIVGIDVGLRRLATLSTGETFANAAPLRVVLRRLGRLQRQLDRQRRAANPENYLPDGRPRTGANEWRSSARMRRGARRVRRLHERVANLRREQAHQLTTQLAREFGVMGVETLNVSGMQSNRRLARHIADVGWALILAQLAYKTSWSDGSKLVAADRFYPSSKTCSGCGTVRAKLSLSERIFTCDACGLVLDRDLNAALNLARMAQQHAQNEGFECYVAAACAETQNARGGQVRPATPRRRSPRKREGSLVGEPSQRREAWANA